jgi:hypothetical protein
LIIGCSSNSNINDRAESLPGEIETTPVSIGPEDATKSSIIFLITEDASMGSTEIHWLVNGMKVEDSGGHKFTPETLRKGDIVQAVVISGNDEFRSNELIIRNSPPSIVRAKLAPELPTADSTITVNVNAKDIDNDFISYDYKWYLNDQYRGNDSYLESEMQRGDIVSLEIAPVDRENIGKSLKLTSKVYNSLPVVSESTPVIEGNIYKHRINVSDLDADTLTFTLKKGPEGMSIDQSGVLTWEITSDDSGNQDIEVLINDNHGAKILLPISASISF